MLSLRAAHGRAQDDPAFVEPDPRPEMARLALEFPGSLREIDTLPLELIVVRIRMLRAAERRVARAEPWMVAQVLFHRYARGALAIKRWLAGRKTITPDVRAAFGTFLGARGHDAEVELFADSLERIACPPGGRLMDVVHEHVARTLDVTTAEARALVFGYGRRRDR
jgi:hypothetical protein